MAAGPAGHDRPPPRVGRTLARGGLHARSGKLQQAGCPGWVSSPSSRARGRGGSALPGTRSARPGPCRAARPAAPWRSSAGGAQPPRARRRGRRGALQRPVELCGGWVRAWIFPLLRPNTSSKHPAPSINPPNPCPQPRSAQCPVGQGRGVGGSATRGCAVTRGVCVCVFEGGRDPAGADRAAGAQRDPQHPRLAAPPGD